MESIRDINTESREGQILLMALGKIGTLPGYTDKTPDEALAELVKVAEETFQIDHGSPFAQARRVMGRELLNRTGEGDDCGYRANIAMLIYDDQKIPEPGEPSAALNLGSVAGCQEMAHRIIQLIFS